MRFAYLAAALIPLAWASPIDFEKRDGTSVLAKLQQSVKDGQVLNQKVSSFGNEEEPSTQILLAINKATTKLNKDLKATTADAKQSSTFTDAESSNIDAFTKGTLAPSVDAIIDNIIAHYVGFKKASAVPVVKNSLTTQKKLAAAEAKAVTAKLTQPYKGQAPAVTKKILAAYDRGIAKFSS